MVHVNSPSRLLTLVGVISLLVAACSANEPAGVASISGTTSTQADGSTEDLDSLLAFAGCMRENGLEDFEDPIVDSGGKVEFPNKADESENKGRFDAAFALCGPMLYNTVFGASKADAESEGVDVLVEFARCMRSAGFDMPDPDPSGQFDEFDEFDKESPEFEAAEEQCADLFGPSKDDK
jgi:hypothetical protein